MSAHHQLFVGLGLGLDRADPELTPLSQYYRSHCAAFDRGDLSELVDDTLLELVKDGATVEAGIYLVSLYRKRVADRAAWGEAS